MSLDPVILSRLQFVWVIAFHILLPAFTVGLASFIAFRSYSRTTAASPPPRDRLIRQRVSPGAQLAPLNRRLQKVGLSP